MFTENPVYKMFIAAFIHYNQKWKTTYPSFSLWMVDKWWTSIQCTTTQQQGGLTTARYKLVGPQVHWAQPDSKDSVDGVPVKAEAQGPKTHQRSRESSWGGSDYKGRGNLFADGSLLCFDHNSMHFLKTHRIIHLEGLILLPASYI